jgi:hypothetical protein
MRSILLLITALSLIQFGFCQHTFRIDFGYGLSTQSDLVGTNLEYAQKDNWSSEKVTGVYGSFGNGIRFNFGYLYRLSEKASIVFDVTRLRSKDWIFDAKETYTDNTGVTIIEQSRRLSLTAWQFQPGVRYVIYSNGKVLPYGMIAIVLSKPKIFVASDLPWKRLDLNSALEPKTL